MNRVYKSTKREKPVSPLVSYWRRLDKPLILAALLCSLLSVILLYSILNIVGIANGTIPLDASDEATSAIAKVEAEEADAARNAAKKEG